MGSRKTEGPTNRWKSTGTRRVARRAMKIYRERILHTDRSGNSEENPSRCADVRAIPTRYPIDHKLGPWSTEERLVWKSQIGEWGELGFYTSSAVDQAGWQEDPAHRGNTCLFGTRACSEEAGVGRHKQLNELLRTRNVGRHSLTRVSQGKKRL